MKRLPFIKVCSSFALIATLTGCAFLSTSRFDPTLYSKAIDSYTENMIALDYCDSPASMIMTVRNLEAGSAYLVKYTQHVSNDVYPVAVEINKMHKELVNAYNTGSPSTAYCTIKLGSARKMLDQLIEVIGRKPK